MTIAPTRIETAAERALREAGEAVARGRGAQSKECYQALLAAYARSGLPTRHEEAFHYTDLRTRVRDAFPPVLDPVGPPGDDERTRSLRRRFGGKIVPFQNGLCDAPETAASVSTGDTLDVLNALLSPRVASFTVLENAQETLTLDHRVAVMRPASIHPRQVIEVRPGARLMLIEIHESAGNHLTNAHMQINIRGDATVAHVKLLAETGAIHLGGTNICIHDRGRYEAAMLAVGPILARQAVHALFAGEGGSAQVSAIALGTGEQHVDYNLFAQHSEKNCTSVQEARIVATQRARGVVQSLVRVGPLASGADARQMIRGLILSPTAEIDAKPELEILNDDVKASHGAAIGDLDPEAVFYLRSRGVAEQEARALLVEAFLAGMLDRVQNEDARTLLKEKMQEWLQNSLDSKEAPRG